MEEKDEVNTLRKELDKLKQEYSGLMKYCKSLESEKRSSIASKHSDVFWEEIDLKCRSDADYIKSLIKDNKITMYDTNKEKQTLLLIAAHKGSYDIVNLCLNLGADLHHMDKEHKKAIDLCREGAFYHVEQLLLFSEMNVNAGNQIRATANTLKKQKGIIENIMNQLTLYDTNEVSLKELFCDTMIDIMTNIINKKLAFSDDVLNLCFRFEFHDNKDILSSKLWQSLCKTCNDIIQNGNSKDWYWLKTFILPSTIWFMDIPREHGESKQQDESTTYLYYELLKLVEGQAHNQLNILERDLNELGDRNKNDWNELIKWEIPASDKDIKQPRQDMVPNAIVPRYTYKALSEQGSSSATFNSHAFYDYYEYLPQLVLLAQIVDDEFQNSVQKIFNIDKRIKQGVIEGADVDGKIKYGDGDGKIEYMRGPVKLIERARSKAENDYYDQIFPTSAHVIDLNRCSLVFNDISTLLRALQQFTNKVKYYESGNIIGIIRDKNGFKEFIKETQYADIKLNVLIKGKTTANNIIGEVQFLLRKMKKFKDKAHNLYSIQRTEEYIENSVSLMLPMLLDEEKQLFVAGNMGDVNSIKNLMVIHNKSNEEIMQIDAKSGESILMNICSFGHNKIFKFMKSLMPTDLFIDRLFLPNRYNESPIEVAVRKQQILLVQTIFEMREVTQKYEENKDQMYRLYYWLFTYGNRSFIDRVLVQLSISSDLIQNFASHYKYTQNLSSTPTCTFAKDAFTFDEQTILCKIVIQKNLDSLEKLVDIIGRKSFIENIAVSDVLNTNPIEYGIRFKAIKMLEYIMSFDGIRNKWKNNKELLFRIVWWLGHKNFYDPLVSQYVLSALELDETNLKEIQLYKCEKPKDKQWPKGSAKYWKKKIEQDAISRLLTTKK